MDAEKFEIRNRHDEIIVLVIENMHSTGGFCVLGHGLGGYKYQPIIRTLAEAFWERGYTTLRFDATHSFGESGGYYEEATATSYYQDLEDVLAWAQGQPYFYQPFMLAGYSLGGLCALWFAENYPEQVEGVAVVATGISGRLFLETIPQEAIEEFEQSGWVISESEMVPGLYKKLRWHQFSEDLLNYDLLERVALLTMPVLLITGEEDTGTPPAHHQILFEKLPGPKNYQIIPGAPHSLIEKRHLAAVKKIVCNWAALAR